MISVFGIRIKIGASFWLLLLLCALFNAIAPLAYMLIALAIHEFGHAIFIDATGMHVECIELTPIGARISLDEYAGDCKDEFIIAMGGPLASLFLAAVCALIYRFFNWEPLIILMLSSLALLCINLLPALPLDGGRMLRAALCSKLERLTANKICAGVGIFIGISLLLIGIYYAYLGSANLTLFIMALLLLTGAIKELKNGAYQSIRSMQQLSDRIGKKGNADVRFIAVREDMSAVAALKLTKKAPMIAIVNQSMGFKRIVSQSDIISAISKKGSGISLKEV